jgi:hypothetical protein
MLRHHSSFRRQRAQHPAPGDGAHHRQREVPDHVHQVQSSLNLRNSISAESFSYKYCPQYLDNVPSMKQICLLTNNVLSWILTHKRS